MRLLRAAQRMSRSVCFVLSVLSVLSVLALPVASEEPVLAEGLNLTAFGGRVDLCAPPLTAENGTCTCAAGWTQQGGTCAACAPGFFKADPGFAACGACPAHMTSFEGAVERAECVCVAGHSREGDACAPCAANTYKAFVGNNSCVSCPTNTHTMGAGATQSTECVCDDGWTASAALATLATCEPCAEDYFSGPSTAGACLPCAANSATPSASAPSASAPSASAGCHCNAGYARDAEAGCSACPAGTYKTERGESACQPCPAHMSSPRGSTRPENCSCVAGYERAEEPEQSPSSAQACVLCAANSFCAGQDAKAACQERSTSEAGASASIECICRDGYFLYDSACVECSENFFCVRGVRTPCAASSASALGSTHAANCTCFTGFGAS